MDLALNNLQRLICHKTQQNQTNLKCKKEMYKQEMITFSHPFSLIKEILKLSVIVHLKTRFL